ncbi:MAG: CHASE3 domain-containing protein [bacterium]|nr:CHASE3 domain-containing protein [bacterium]
MKFKFEHLIVIGFSFALALLVLTGVISFRTNTAYINTTRQIIRIQTVLKELEATQSTIEATESRMKGYVISGKESYYKQYAQSVAKILEQINYLKKQMPEDNDNLQRMALLERMIGEKIDFVQRIVALRQEGKIAEVNELLSEEKEKKEMDDVSDAIELIRKDETALLEQAEKESINEIRDTRITLTVLMLMAIVLLSVGLYLITMDISKRRLAESKLMKTTEELRNLTSHVESIRENERTNISREIHDELGQLLTAIQYDLEVMNPLGPKAGRLYIRRKGALKKLINQAIQTVKRISYELRPAVLDGLGLSESLAWLLRDFTKRTGIKHTLAVDPNQVECDKDVTTTLFRIAQESLTNVMRHAKASKVEVGLLLEGNNLKLTIRDDGIGIPGEKINDGHSLGLIGMRERLYSGGGSITIEGKANQGTLIKVIIPFGENG